MKFIRTAEEMKALAKRLGMSLDWHASDGLDVELSIHIPLMDRVTPTILGTDESNSHNHLETGNFVFDNSRIDDTEAFVVVYKNGRPAARVNVACLMAFACGWQGMTDEFEEKT